MTTNYGQQVYGQGPGTASTKLLDAERQPRNPTDQDINYPLGKLWVNTINFNVFYYVSQSTTGGNLTAIWVEISAGLTPGALDTLTGDIGGVVNPVAGNINVRGGAAGAVLFSNGGAGLLSAQVQVDGTTIDINGSDQLEVIGSIVTGTITTLDATPTTLFTFPMPAVAGVVTFDILISGFAAAGPIGGGFSLIGAVRTTGAAATALPIDDTINSVDNAFQAANVDITASGNNALIQVIGIVATTIHWRGQLRTISVA